MRFVRFCPVPVWQAPDAPSSPASGSGDTPASTPSNTPSTTAPSQSPTTPSSEAPPTPSSTEGVDSSFDFMFNPKNEDPLDGLGLPAKEPKPKEPTVTQPTPAKPELVAQPEAPKTPVPSPAPAPTETPSPPAQANLDPYDPGALAQHLAQNEEQAVQYAAENLFRLSPKDVEDLESDVVGTIPRLLARTLVASQRNFLMQLSQLVPRMIQQQGAVSKAHGEAEGEFYTRWPDIKKDQHGELVLQYARDFGQMHPQATRQERIEAVGPMVMMAAKIVPTQTPPAAAPLRPSPMAPTGVNGRPPQPTPFMPAGPSAGGPSQSTAPQLSEIEAMFVDD